MYVMRTAGAAMLALAGLLSACKTAEPVREASADGDLSALLDAVLPLYEQHEFSDPQTGVKLSYNLFVPPDYDAAKSYPLVLFITDASVVGKDTESALTQGWGGVIWASPEEQAKHPCLVLVPEYPRVIVNDADETTEEVAATVNLLSAVMNEYSIDRDRVYISGQSMGGMTALYLNKTYPDLFAASYIVACQWGTAGMEALADSRIFYLVSADDTKASPGQDAIRSTLEAAGARVETGIIDAAASQKEIEQAVQEVLSRGSGLNFLKYAENSILKKTGARHAHMATWQEAYKIEAARDWLFAQSKAAPTDTGPAA